MNIREIDWRLSSVRQIISAISHGLAANEQSFHEGGDIDDACEYHDDLCGIAFVAAQAYITATVSDAKAIRGPRSPIGKVELLKIGNPIVADTKLTRMELCDAMANYYKHRDEWPTDWKDCKKFAKITTELLHTAGFKQNDEYLCTTVATLLFGDVKVGSLLPLVDMLSSWRAAVIASAKN